MEAGSGSSDGPALSESGKYVDQAEFRRLYKICVDCAKKLDQSTKDRRQVGPLSHPDVVAARVKLLDACERLLLKNPVEFGRKAEDLIWKKCFYDPIQVFRQNKDHLSEEDRSQACVLGMAAAGFYHGFLLRLQHLPDTSNWTNAAIFKTLICLGDISRYQTELEETQELDLAAHYYTQALSLKPEHGMPFNQLGTLFRWRDHGLDAVYFYLRCIVSRDAFDGAQGNLLQIFKSNEKLYQNLSDATSFRSFVVVFIYLISLFWDDSADEVKGREMERVCGETLMKMDKWLRAGHAQPLFFVVVILIIIVKKLQDNASTKLPTAINLFCATFFHIMNWAVVSIHNHQTKKQTEDGTAGEVESVLEKKEESEDEEKRSRRRRPPNLLRRRRRGSRSSSDDNDCSGSDGGVESETGGDVIELPESETEEEVTEGRVVSPGEDSGCQSTGSAPEDLLRLSADAQKPLTAQDLRELDQLTVIKVSCDWFRSNPNLVVSLPQNWRKLWARFSTLVNLLPSEEALLKIITNDAKLKQKLSGEVWSPLCDWFQKQPLSEDVSLRALPALAQTYSTLDLDNNKFLDACCQNLIRVFSIRSFGHFLIRLNVPGFSYDRKQGLFHAEQPADDGKEEATRGSLTEERRRDLMKNMAKLRVQDELERLERVGWIPVYLVPDGSALMAQLPLVRQLVSAQRFVVVLPQCTIRELDEKKKESGAVREAIRWLETMLRRGNKFLRPQSDSDIGAGFPSQELALAACCAGLGGSVTGDASGSTVVSLLCAHAPDSLAFKRLQDAVRTVGAPGTNVENVQVFSKRWQSLRKKSG